MQDAYRTYTEEVEAHLAELGHEMVWEPAGERLRHGVCKRCGRTVVIVSADGFFRSSGRALHEPCEP